jgi:alkylhydroperoxidase/carboxymuconolactone decarboxylase family protein YurZ
MDTNHEKEGISMSRQPSNHYLKLKERHGDLLNAVEALGKTARNSGPLDDKTIHLIQLGAAAAIMSHGSTHSHAVRALEAGATAEEVRHAVIVLTSTIGFPIVAAALSWVDDVIAKF